MRMGNYIGVKAHILDVNESDTPPIGINHITIVPTNLHEREETAGRKITRSSTNP
ncbi:MAG: hypothetical protein ABEI52_09850 [Halobacteriaceae archaeon]